MGMDVAGIKKHFAIDATRKTVLVIDTSLHGFFGSGAKFGVSTAMETGMVKLAETFNVILCLHPLDMGRIGVLSQLERKGVHINYGALARNSKGRGPPFPSMVPFWEIADVIVGASSGALHQATYYPSRPILMYRPTIVDGCDYKKIFNAPGNKYILLGPEVAIVFHEAGMQNSGHLPALVQQALTDPDHESKTKARRFYFHRFNGYPDGYEDFRQQLCFLDHQYNRLVHDKPQQEKAAEFSTRLHRLKQLYSNFTMYNNQPLRDPILACADFETRQGPHVTQGEFFLPW